MIPIKDQNPTRTFPFVNYLLIAVNVAAYVWEALQFSQSGEAAVVSGYGLVATRLLSDPAGEALPRAASVQPRNARGWRATSMPARGGPRRR